MEHNKPVTLDPGLYVAATPIGNLRDITLRVLDLLGACDLILCEDSRVTGKLLAAYGISTPMALYHEHNAAQARPGILQKLAAGAAIALVSDAGTPLISDPGYKLVAAARDRGLPVFAAPGPSALTAAVSVAGLPTDAFYFAGFAPAKPSARRAAFQALKGLAATLVFYETGPRLAASLADMAEAFGDRDACLLRELTKLHEEARRGTLTELAAEAAAGAPPKGEIVVIVGRAGERAAADDEIDAALGAALGEMSLKDAAKTVAEALGAPRKTVYARALALKARGE